MIFFYLLQRNIQKNVAINISLKAQEVAYYSKQFDIK